jgi:hypothetical protein
MNPMDSFEAQRRLEQLRTWRTKPAADAGIADGVEALRARLDREYRAGGGLGAVWLEVVPKELGDTAELILLSGGVLTVRVRDSSTRFALDRWLRSGGQKLLEQRSPTTLRRIKLVG